MVRRAAEAALGSRCRPVVVVTGASADAVEEALAGLDVGIVRNSRWADGIGTSIGAGISLLSGMPVDAVVISLADQPRLAAADYDGLVELHQRTGCAVVASEYSGTLGVPALFARSCFDDLLSLPPGQGCKAVILARPEGAVARRACPNAAIDVDTPADLARLGVS